LLPPPDRASLRGAEARMLSKGCNRVQLINNLYFTLLVYRASANSSEAAQSLFVMPPRQQQMANVEESSWHQNDQPPIALAS